MKKIVSVMLTLLLVFSLTVPAFATQSVFDARNMVPVIRLSGDGDALYDADNNKILKLSDLFGSDGGSVDTGNIYEALANILMPFLIEGVVGGNYDHYYDALQKEIGDMFENAKLDNDGNATGGSGISQARKDYMANCLATDKKADKGYYEYNDYWFWYDWRLDPLESADTLHEYIQGIKAVTGAPKVAIYSSCLGTSVALAYVSKYGLDDIHGIGFNGSVVNGAEPMSEPISGKLNIDGNAVKRFILDSKGLGEFSIDDFIVTTLDLLTKSGAIDSMTGAVKDTIYNTLVEGVTSALALSTFFTWPNYWAGVTDTDYDTAMQYVFGKEGSKKRSEYAGLIAKIENYNTNVRTQIPNLMKEIADNANICIVSKYGFQIMPIVKSCDAIADQFASVNRSSFGATTSTIYDTLSDDYIAKRVAEGKGKYISPDKQIDASTCLFPDYTWFTKGSTHSNWSPAENKLIYSVITADRQYTIDDFDLTQFMVYSIKTGSMSPMTKLNCYTTFWDADTEEDKPTTQQNWVIALIRSLVEWFKLVFKILFK